jgi:hypothetical protein
MQQRQPTTRERIAAHVVVAVVVFLGANWLFKGDKYAATWTSLLATGAHYAFDEPVSQGFAQLNA